MVSSQDDEFVLNIIVIRKSPASELEEQLLLRLLGYRTREMRRSRLAFHSRVAAKLGILIGVQAGLDTVTQAHLVVV